MSSRTRIVQKYFKEGPGGEFEGVKIALPRDLAVTSAATGTAALLTEVFTDIHEVAQTGGYLAVALGVVSIATAGITYAKDRYDIVINYNESYVRPKNEQE